MTFGFDRDFIPWGKRDKEPEPRIYEKITDDDEAVRRFAFTLTEISETKHIKQTFKEYRTETGHSPGVFLKQASGDAQMNFLLNTENDRFLQYVEILLNIMWSSSEYERNSILMMDTKLRRILRERRILLRLRPDHDTLDEQSFNSARMNGYKNHYTPSEDGWIRFEQLGDETVVEADQDIRVLQQGTNWDEALNGYNEAWELYQDGQFTYIIPEKLYNSLEAVCQKICVDLEGWNSKGDTVGTYLSTMQKKDLFKPNDTMVGEWQQIYGGMQTGIQKLGGDRKRHEELDQDYCILLLHQTAAFLTFVIKRYEDKYGE